VQSRVVLRGRIPLWLYNLLLWLVALLVAPIAGVLCLVRPAWRRGLENRFGFGWPAADGRARLWAHAASVGEIEGIAPLVERWRNAHPDGSVVVSALTATGCDVARTILPWATVRFFPFDLAGIAPRVVRRLRPDLFLFSENEIWPNTLTALAAQGVPTIQVSGRLSDSAASTLGRFPELTRTVLGAVTRYCVQSQGDRDRLVHLGVDAGRVVVTGSLKGDGRLAPSPAFLDDIRALGRPLVVAGSTHEGEERMVLGAVRLLGGSERPPFWILAPRHPERFDGVAALLERERVHFVRRTGLPRDPGLGRAALETADVLLLDSIGELAGCFPGASACFIGGSLVPIGGHNLLEPARCGVPIVVGPHLDSVRELAARLEEVGAAIVVQEPGGLARALADLIERGDREAASRAARDVAEELAGSLARTWACLEEAIEASAPGEAAR